MIKPEFNGVGYGVGYGVGFNSYVKHANDKIDNK